eukprot:9264788-Lingulodinium_polyedra.AAC.1
MLSWPCDEAWRHGLVFINLRPRVHGAKLLRQYEHTRRHMVLLDVVLRSVPELARRNQLDQRVAMPL